MKESHPLSPPDLSSSGPQNPTDITIVLVGMMGAGKTSVGRCLAARLGLAFTDADAAIEQTTGKTIARIFQIYGEPAFRNKERHIMTKLLTHSGGIIAAGGGAFMDPHIRRCIRERAISVWLKADPDRLLRRVHNSRTRPLLNAGNPRTTLARLIKQRYPIYNLADLTVDGSDRSPSAVAEDIIERLPSVTRKTSSWKP
ncbi:MAG: shikimate kinase [Parvularculales bacterium]